MRKWILAFMLLVFMASSACANIVLDNLTTGFERSTPGNAIFTRSLEARQFIRTAAQHSGGRIRYETMGHTSVGTPIPLAIVGYPRAPISPANVGSRVVVWILAGMHGGENTGVDANLIFLREVAQGRWDHILGNVVVLVSPVYNADGVDGGASGQRENARMFDLNRDFSKMTALETRALFRQFRRWDPAILMDQHHIGTGPVRHSMTYATGRSTINHPEINAANQAFSNSIWGLRRGAADPAMQATNFFYQHMKALRDNPATPALLGGSGGGYTLSAADNHRMALTAIPYVANFPTTAASAFWEVIDGVNRLVRLNGPNGDNTRTTLGYFTAKGRFGVLTEFPSQHPRFTGVHAHYASTVSVIDQAGRQRDTILAVLNRHDTERNNLANTDGLYLSLGVFSGINTANINDGVRFPSRNDHYYTIERGIGTFRLEGFPLVEGTTGTFNRGIDDVYFPEIWSVNLPNNETQMGAFYIIDSRAHKAVEGLLRHGVQVHRLTRDVLLPADTVKFGSTRAGGVWGVRKHGRDFENHISTRVEFGNWLDAPNYLARAGSYVLSTAQTFGRFGAYWIEPRAVCGGFVWNYFDDVLDLDTTVTFNVNLPQPGITGITETAVPLTPAYMEMVKTFSYAAIPADALELVPPLVEDLNLKPNFTFAPPFLWLNGDFSSLTDVGAGLESATQNAHGDVTLVMRDASLYDGMWLTFFFYDATGKHFDVLAQVSAAQVAGTNEAFFEAFFLYEELLEAGLVPGGEYFIHYSNNWGGVYGYGTLTKGALAFSGRDEPSNGGGGSSGCNAGFMVFVFVLLAAMPFVLRKK